ncbi:MAG: hypothetical protein U7126_02560 [Microcoleus sp.]
MSKEKGKLEFSGPWELGIGNWAWGIGHGALGIGPKSILTSTSDSQSIIHPCISVKITGCAFLIFPIGLDIHKTLCHSVD